MKKLLILLLLVPSLSWGGLGWSLLEVAYATITGVLGLFIIVFIPIVIYIFLKKIINKSSTNNSSSSVYKTLEKKYDNWTSKKDTPEFIPTSQRETNQTKPISPQSMALNEEKEKEDAIDAIKERNRRDKEIALKEDKEKKANKANNSKDYEVEKQKQSQLEKELELINSVYKEKEIEHQESIQEQNKIKAEENKKLEELKNLNFDELRKKKEEIEKKLNLSNENNN